MILENNHRKLILYHRAAYTASMKRIFSCGIVSLNQADGSLVQKNKHKIVDVIA